MTLFPTGLTLYRGINVDPSMRPAFHKEDVKLVFSEHRIYKRVGSHKLVFMTVDPCGSGTGSKYAIVSCIYIGEKMIVIAADSSHNHDPSENIKVLWSHIDNIRRKPEFRNCTIVFIAESNFGSEAYHLERMIRERNIPRVCIMHEDQGRSGARTGLNKPVMAHLLDYKLTRREVYIYEDFTFGDTLNKDNVMTEKKLLEEFENELLNFTRIQKKSKVRYGQPVELYSGKQDYGYDDLVMAMMINCFMEQVFYTKPQYRQWY